MIAHQDAHMEQIFKREGMRLRNFIRSRVPTKEIAEDILQDVFYQLVETYRLVKPVEHASAWLFTVARNKITDLLRKKKAEPASNNIVVDEDQKLSIIDMLPATDAGPEAEFARSVLLEELEEALAELPKNQRSVFIAHELEGKSFNELSNESGLTVNTLLSRKRYAVVHLRKRLRQIYDEFINN
ncbi:MAG: RNA polymerase subunit sigma-24 [Flavobacteriales bacterium]|nr:MAG: RNA polymerase subunit sigma-24 [Flavobacteriales bacterium]